MKAFCKKIQLPAISMLLMGMPAFAHAISVTSAVPANPVPAGRSFEVVLLLNSDQPVNAYAITFRYDTDHVRLDAINNANSILSLWKQNPTAVGGEITFAGASFTPFRGAYGKLLTLDFTATAPGVATFTYDNATAYLANGKGTPVAPRIDPAMVTISSGTAIPAMPTSSEQAKVAPPVIALLSMTPDPYNSGQKLLGFVVTDTGTGVASYAFRSRSGFFWSDWRAAQNPTPLSNGVWTIDFKVTDNSGNVAEMVLYDWGAFAYFILFWAAVLVAATGIVLWVWSRRRFQMIKW